MLEERSRRNHRHGPRAVHGLLLGIHGVVGDRIGSLAVESAAEHRVGRDRLAIHLPFVLHARAAVLHRGDDLHDGAVLAGDRRVVVRETDLQRTLRGLHLETLPESPGGIRPRIGHGVDPGFGQVERVEIGFIRLHLAVHLPFVDDIRPGIDDGHHFQDIQLTAHDARRVAHREVHFQHVGDLHDIAFLHFPGAVAGFEAHFVVARGAERIGHLCGRGFERSIDIPSAGEFVAALDVGPELHRIADDGRQRGFLHRERHLRRRMLQRDHILLAAPQRHDPQQQNHVCLQ